MNVYQYQKAWSPDNADGDDCDGEAAVLTVRIAKNHPLPDGNKRLACQPLTMLCALNGYPLEVPTDEAVGLVLAIAAGDLTETEVATPMHSPARLRPRRPNEPQRDLAARPAQRHSC